MDRAPFVGRRQQRMELGALIARGRAGARPVAGVVRGEMGVGKTRLLEEVTAEHFFGAIGYSVTGYEAERIVPLGAAAPMLNGMTSVPGEGPRLRGLLEDTGGRPKEWLRIFEAARRCLVAEPPAVLLLDDLQWSDELSRSLVHYLIRAADESGVSLPVLCGTRPTSDAFGFVDALGRLLGPARLLSLTLEPMDRVEGVELVSSVAPTLDERDAVDWWERCGGIPFWLVRADPGDLGGVADDAFRFWDLPADATDLAALLAVLSAPTDPAQVAEMLGWTTARTREATDSLLRRGLASNVDGAVKVVHDMVRDSLLSTLPEHLVRQTHGRIAEYLGGTGRNDVRVLHRVLNHQLAGGFSGADVALRILRTADRGLLGSADLHEFARIADAEHVSGNQSTAHVLQTEVASAATALGFPEVAAEQWAALMTSAATAADGATAALRASIGALEAGDRVRATVLLRECRPRSLADVPLHITYLAHLSELHAVSGHESEDPMRRATAMADRLSESAGPGLTPEARTAYLAAHQAAYYFELRNDRPDRMLAEADLMAAAGISVDDRLRALLHRVLALRLQARYSEAEKVCQFVRLAAVREQLPSQIFLSGYLQALCLHSLGHLQSARDAITDVATLAERAPVVIPSWLSTPFIRALIPEIEASMVGWATARTEFIRLADAERTPHFRLHVRAAGAQWAARIGGPDNAALAAQWARDGAQDAELAGCARCAAEHGLRSAEVYARIGKRDAARRLLDHWDATHTKTSGQATLWRVRVVGLLQSLQGNHHDAIHALDAARFQAEATNATLEQVWCELDLGAALAEIDRVRAVEVLHRAADTAGKMRAMTEERRALQALRSLGVRTWRPGRHGSTPESTLTDREESIAHMITDGASNPEIAEALFLSRKTVERHVSNILTKAGVRNRAELASRFIEEMSRRKEQNE